MNGARLELRRVRGIVFDLDGTLIDSYAAIAESLNGALARMSRPELGFEEVRALVGRGLETLMARALGSEGASPSRIAEGVRLFRERYDQICVERTRLLPGVATTLETLHARGYRMSVATNKPSSFARKLLDALSVGTLLDAVVGPGEVGRHKPHPEMVLAALSAMGLAPREAICVGDMEVDVETARAAGVPVVVVPTGSRSLAELEASGADVVIARFASLLDLLPGPLLESSPS